MKLLRRHLQSQPYVGENLEKGEIRMGEMTSSLSVDFDIMTSKPTSSFPVLSCSVKGGFLESKDGVTMMSHRPGRDMVILTVPRLHMLYGKPTVEIRTDSVRREKEEPTRGIVSGLYVVFS